MEPHDRNVEVSDLPQEYPVDRSGQKQGAAGTFFHSTVGKMCECVVV